MRKISKFAIFCIICVSSLLVHPSVNSQTQTGILANRVGVKVSPDARKDKSKIPVVITMVSKEYKPESELNDSERKIQRQNVSTKIQSLAKKYNLNQFEKLETFPIVATMVNSDQLDQMSLDQEIFSVTENFAGTPTLAQTTPLVGSTTTAANGFGGQNQTIAIIDTGVDLNHPFFQNKNAGEMCVSHVISTGDKSHCPGGVTFAEGNGVARHCNYYGPCVHGTHVAGIAAGKGPSFSGVAKEAKIYSVQASTLAADGSVIYYYSSLLMALEKLQQKVNAGLSLSAINISFYVGTNFTDFCDNIYPALSSIINSLTQKGVAVISANGNNGATYVGSPACIQSVVRVSATSKSDEVAFFSNNSNLTDLLAPGDIIQSSFPNGGYGYMKGTSMAAPHVAGAFAILKQGNPSKSVQELKSALISTGKPIKDYTRGGVTKPRIQIDKALDSVVPKNYNYSLYLQYGDGIPVLMKIDSTGKALETKSFASLGTPGPDWRIVDIVDLNNDGRLDIMWQHSSGPIGVWELDANLNFSKFGKPDYPNPGPYWQLQKLVDMNGDNILDFVWSYLPNGQLGVWFMDTQGNIKSTISIQNPTGGASSRIVGLNRLN